jgi:translation initiation factor 1
VKNNPFADLGKQLGVPASEEPASSDAIARPARPSESRGPARAVVRMERAGRGGKEATVIEQLGLPRADLDTWLKALKAALGCGGAIEGEHIVLQGDHRKRLPSLLTARGVRKVIVG